MKFFLDENFPKSACELLNSLGHEWIDLRGTDREGCEDAVIFDMAQKQEAIFLTTDRDFFHTVPHLKTHHRGVVVVALSQPNRKSILARLQWFLNQYADTDISNHVFELRDRTYIDLHGLSDSH